ncbi:hypothetical protein Afil01_33960 [Actinorhabdospora filicis]|uniref:Zinc finger CGNR domain-containing protein n=1 Tax=Actinorhabdospora filicis TaxID=1785913 RepID=A0A9W6W9G3_9ACTN|nr:CGNR zinc finger domain-containing protein [Actinorhabdospora filicis]GLZ78589.1 hypothetical protein Afil01_33960 [Actinorhabdospora filicis]
MSRPLEGEPLALDLVNTVWMDAGVRHDLFEEDALTAWLGLYGFPAEGLAGLVETREAIRACLRGEGEDALNAVLARGRVRYELRDGRRSETVEAPPEWGPAWRAARAYVDLVAEARPERIRKCANPDCLLWFHDVSKNGRRRWCSMEGCGNRAKAARHAARVVERRPEG